MFTLLVFLGNLFFVLIAVLSGAVMIETPSLFSFIVYVVLAAVIITVPCGCIEFIRGYPF